MQDSSGSTGVPPQAKLTVEDIRQYVLFRGYDCIGHANGGYKKFLTASREQQQPWALAMSASLSRVQAATKEIMNKINELKSMQQHAVANVSCSVLENNLPPDDAPVELATCAITGKTNTRCFAVQSKSKTPLHIHVRFREYVRNLWLFMRMEQVIKSYTRTFIESHPASNPHRLIVEFDALKDDHAAFSAVFLQAYEHVGASLSMLMNSTVQPVDCAPAGG